MLMPQTMQLSTTRLFSPDPVALRQQAAQWLALADRVEREQNPDYALFVRRAGPRLSLLEYRQLRTELNDLYHQQAEFLAKDVSRSWCDTPQACEITRLESLLGL